MPDIDNITEYDLRDDEAMKALYLEAVHRGFWPNSTGAVLEFWSLAEKALKEDKRDTPGRLFYGLVKRKNLRFITDAMERRAMERIGSGDREELAERAGGITSVKKRLSREEETDLIFGPLTGRKIGYHHGVMIQCFMPRKRHAANLWQSDHGKASLLIRAGMIPNPGTHLVGEFTGKSDITG